MKKLLLMVAFTGLLVSTAVANSKGDDKDKNKKDCKKSEKSCAGMKKEDCAKGEKSCCKKKAQGSGDKTIETKTTVTK